MLLCVANWGGVEVLRMVLVCAVVGALWAVGWVVTPEKRKRWAWGYVKGIWYWIVVDEILGMARGQTRRVRRRN